MSSNEDTMQNLLHELQHISIAKHNSSAKQTVRREKYHTASTIRKNSRPPVGHRWLQQPHSKPKHVTRNNVVYGLSQSHHRLPDLGTKTQTAANARCNELDGDGDVNMGVAEQLSSRFGFVDLQNLAAFDFVDLTDFKDDQDMDVFLDKHLVMGNEPEGDAVCRREIES